MLGRALFLTSVRLPSPPTAQRTPARGRICGNALCAQRAKLARVIVPDGPERGGGPYGGEW